ncbi:hypothetical protein JW949_04375 [Candidatus Woesearchaeota archaeon]|nr:hypothetical protein [Candidatus Woesearchaeota archaeon]
MLLTSKKNRHKESMNDLDLTYIFDDFSLQKHDSDKLKREVRRFYKKENFSVIFGERKHMDDFICESIERDIYALKDFFGVNVFLELLPFLNNDTTIKKPVSFSELVNKEEFNKKNSGFSDCILRYIEMGKDFLENDIDVFVFNDHQGNVWDQNKRMYERILNFDEGLNNKIMVFVLGLKHLVGYRSFQKLINKKYPSIVYIKDDPRMIPPLKEVCSVKKDRETLEYKIN